MVVYMIFDVSFLARTRSWAPQVQARPDLSKSNWERERLGVPAVESRIRQTAFGCDANFS